jgi:SAM-dependent methyltransferase/predicted  nucleic acid-binding Zn-ribbon protein
MSQPQPLEEVMQRIRANLIRRPSSTAQQVIPLPWNAPRDSQSVPANAGSSLQTELQACNLSPLRTEIDGALEGHKLVGQINPRAPGIHNQAIQFVKRVMLRTLTWYTRPLHYFQGSVIRALQQIAVTLKHHDDSLQKVAREFTNQAIRTEQRGESVAKQGATVIAALAAANQRASALGDRVTETAARTARLEEKTTTLSDQFAAMSELTARTARLEETTTALEETTTALEETTTALEETTEGFSEQLTSLGEMTAAVQTVVGEFDRKTEKLEEKLRQESTALFAGDRAVREEGLNRALAPYSQSLTGISDEIAWLRSELIRLGNELRETKLQNRMHDRDLRRFLHDIPAGTLPPSGQPNPTPTPPMFPSGIRRESEFDYFRFEEHYRGDEALIANRHKEYLEFFRGRENVVDIGCGRGEFLELLRENGISAKGVELGTDQYLLCREKALEVAQQDLFSYLESLPDESLGGLFSAQVIEHLTASDQLRLVSLAYRKTRPGSPVVFETINAQCVFAVMRNFFIDPTHIRPVHPETLKFAMESANFHDVELRFSSAMTERQIPSLKLNGDTPQLAEFNRAMEGLNELIYGFMDYAAIGWR